MKRSPRRVSTHVCIPLLASLAGCGTEAPPTEPTLTEVVASVEVTAPTDGVVVSASLQMTARARDAAGRTISGKTFTWSSDDEAVARVDSAGRVTGGEPGHVTITASVDGTSGDTTLRVFLPNAAMVTIAALRDSLVVGDTVRLEAIIADSADNVIHGMLPEWSSTDQNVAHVDSTGLVTALVEGTATITARLDGVSGSVLLTIMAPDARATVSFLRSDEIFPNPERGFWTDQTARSSEFEPLDEDNLRAWRAEHRSIVRRIYTMPSFRSSDLSPQFLAQVHEDFAIARSAGVKLILRFAYNFNEPDGSESDASKPVILRHIEQLTPLLQEHVDVVDHVEAGFIGLWGEWHTSSEGLLEATVKRDILFKLLDALPSSRMVALRYPRDKQGIFETDEPLMRAEAFTGSPRARTGFHNDCFLANEHDAGTYVPYDFANSRFLPPDPGHAERQKRYLAEESRYVIQGGETCQPHPPRSDCPTALSELRQMRWRSINPVFREEVTEGWKAQGCWPEIERRLGYRFRLVEASLPTTARPGDEFRMWFTITNDGWGTPYNQRAVRVVLRHRITEEEYAIAVQADPRFWLPEEIQAVRVRAILPPDLQSGEYDVMLHLADPMPRLRGRPEYSIRLANEGIWQAHSGQNSFLSMVRIP